jgi:hypothetical protein
MRRRDVGRISRMQHLLFVVKGLRTDTIAAADGPPSRAGATLITLCPRRDQRSACRQVF